MIRKAFFMSDNEGCKEDYEQRHNPIWPELEQTLKDHGVLNHSIFLDPQTRRLFAETESGVCRRSWESTNSLMPSNENSSPVSRELRKTFHIKKDS
ncbi:L-rhamnose mutarotase [Haloferula sp.]|uniref:L-rhamnose mutarotase n=1 Tax=Haloferula sp. TaxID=2497595 RepID=UPI00329C58F1